MKQSFITSYLTFYLKSSITLEGDFVKTSNPNTILKIIPLGSQNKTIPVDQIAGVDDSFSLDFKSFAWGVIFAILGVVMLDQSLVSYLILLAYGIATVLSSFQTNLKLNLASGGEHTINAIIFEKTSILTCKETIEGLIQRRYDDTNVATHTQTQTDVLVNAMTNKK